MDIKQKIIAWILINAIEPVKVIAALAIILMFVGLTTIAFYLLVAVLILPMQRVNQYTLKIGTKIKNFVKSHF